jgi:hypothetical protein
MSENDVIFNIHDFKKIVMEFSNLKEAFKKIEELLDKAKIEKEKQDGQT